MSYSTNEKTYTNSSKSPKGSNSLASPQLLWKALALSCNKLGIPAKRFKRRFFQLQMIDQHMLLRLWLDESKKLLFGVAPKMPLDRDALEALFNLIEDQGAELILLSINLENRAFKGEGDYD